MFPYDSHFASDILRSVRTFAFKRGAGGPISLPTPGCPMWERCSEGSLRVKTTRETMGKPLGT